MLKIKVNNLIKQFGNSCFKMPKTNKLIVQIIFCNEISSTPNFQTAKLVYISSFSFTKFPLFLRLIIWSCGRVARQSSAKASTAVRIRSGPLKPRTGGVFHLYETFSTHRNCGLHCIDQRLFYALGFHHFKANIYHGVSYQRHQFWKAGIRHHFFQQLHGHPFFDPKDLGKTLQRICCGLQSCMGVTKLFARHHMRRRRMPREKSGYLFADHFVGLYFTNDFFPEDEGDK
jgi:hypothetical protein